MDKRWARLGDILVNYSTEVKPGEKVMIAFVELETYPLVHAIYEACVKAGAFPQVQFLSEELNRLVLKHGSLEQIDWTPEIEAYGMEWADVYFGLRGAHNLDVFWDVPAEKLALLRKAMGKISTLRWQKTRWCLVRVPNAALAIQANVDEETIMDMFFNACFLDWPVVGRQWRAWAEILNQGKQVRVVGQRTDLSFSVEGRSWDAADGHANMPDGEIATSPVESSLDGTIYFDHPGVLGGRLMHDICLRWDKGKLVEASSTTNQDYLLSVINTDPGASLVGEFAIGTNPQVTVFSKDILLDEKIDGSIHIALGRAYPNTGGTNQSAIHWDIIKDMRQGGEIYLDGRLVYKGGKVLL
ncbi:MAG TPA: aminopeptidase [Aggregatilineaceae bacterium]|nr:aminopeptidase [Aggregatilineaceae bacterium]